MRRALPLFWLFWLVACGDQSFKAINAEPIAAITSHTDGATVGEGELVRFEGRVSDASHAYDELSVTWRVDGTTACAATPPSEDGTTACDISLDADATVLLEVVDPRNAAGVDSVDIVVEPAEVADDPPVVDDLSLTPSPPTTDETLNATATGTDPEGAEVTFTYAWTVNGADPGESGPSLDGTAHFDKGDMVVLTVTPNDGGQDGEPAIAEVVVANSPPSAADALITPSAPDERDDLLCEVPIDSIDADGDAVTYTVTWTVDGVAFAGATTTSNPGDTVDAGATAEGETWTCTVTPSDGEDAGETAEDSVVIDNAFGDWPGDLDEDDADVRLVGEAAGDTVRAVQSADLDGDGLAELLVGAHYNDRGATESGTLYVFDDVGALSGVVDLASADVILPSTAAYGGAANTLASPGDLDGDGVDDVALAHHDSDWRGSTTLVSGATLLTTTAASIEDAAWVTLSAENPANYGNRVAAAGDVDGDGLGDLVTGAWGWDETYSNRGRAYLTLGADLPGSGTLSMGDAAGVWSGDRSNHQCGYAVAGLGDLDGDGFDDFGVFCRDTPSDYVGEVYVLRGGVSPATGTDLATRADHCLTGGGTYQNLGETFGPAGDLDGDAVPAIYLSAPGSGPASTGSGTVYVVEGDQLSGAGCTSAPSVASWAISGSGALDATAGRQTRATDIDGDGHDDLLLTALLNDDAGTNAGAAGLFLGASLGVGGTFDMSDADHAFSGTADNDYLGREGDFVPDATGDGIPEVALVAPGSDVGGDGAGEAWLFWGD